MTNKKWKETGVGRRAEGIPSGEVGRQKSEDKQATCNLKLVTDNI